MNSMRFHALTDNTANYLQGANNFPYGPPPKLEDNEMDCDPDAAKCFCCGGWFPMEDCVINHDEEHKAVPVCETCASGRVG